jgi:hypothetical protein
MSKQTVTINGTVYDAHTGMPVSVDNATPAPTPVAQPHSQSVHQVTQKSQTLNRRLVQQKPSVAPASSIQKSPQITKFAPQQPQKQPSRVVSDFGPAPHPMATRANQQLAPQPAAQAPKPSQIIKQEAIAQAMQTAPDHNRTEKAPKQVKKIRRFASVGSVSLALLLLGGYFTYLNMPSLSVRVAAAQSGVDASYPEYRPDGYSLSGAVAYSQGQVSMKFAANGGDQNFTINQSKSNWDSVAVLDNYVKEKAGDKYITYSERGLTIYTYNSNAAWVNGGVLYTINGDAPLSSDQIRRIATSL